MGKNYAKCCQAKIFVQEANHNLLSLGQNDGKNRFCELSNDELYEILENAIPAMTNEVTISDGKKPTQRYMPRWLFRAVLYQSPVAPGA